LSLACSCSLAPQQEQGAFTDDDPIREDFTQDRDDEPVSDSGALHAAR